MKYLTKYLKKLKQFRKLTRQVEETVEDILNPEVEDLYEIHTLPEKPEAWCVKFISGEYEGLIYTYAKVELNPNSENLGVVIETDFLWIPESLRKKEMPDEKKQELDTIIGKIAMNILFKNADALEDDGDRLVLKDVK